MSKKSKALFFILFLTTILEGLYILKNPKIKLPGFYYLGGSVDFVQASGTWIPEPFLERPNQAATVTCSLDSPKRLDWRGEPYLGDCIESRAEIASGIGSIILNIVTHYYTIRSWNEREIIAINTAQCGRSVLKVDLIHEQVTTTHTVPNKCGWGKRKGQTWQLLLGDGRKSS